MAANILVADATGVNRLVGANDIGSGSELLVQRMQPVVGVNDVSMTNGLPVVHGDVAAQTGTLGALNAAVTASMAGMGSVAFGVITGTFALTVAFEACYDATGTNWFPLLTSRIDSSTSYTAVSLTNSGFAWTAAGDGGMTFARIRCSAYTSGSASVFVAPSAAAIDPAPTASLAASSSRIGSIFNSGVWYDTTSTPLAASGAFTGGSRDLLNSNSGTQFASSGTYPGEYRVSAEADVAGTLYLEASRDGTTWRRIKGVATAAFDGTSVQYAEFAHKLSTRYIRPVYVNGANAQTQFMLQEMLMGAV